MSNAGQRPGSKTGSPHNWWLKEYGKQGQDQRSRIARMIGTWQDVLRFHFAPVDDSMTSEELEQLEEDLNTALLPPFSEGDLEADTKKKRMAFR